MGRQDRTAPFLRLPTNGELVKFELHRVGGPTADNFKLDLEGAPTSGWNRRAAVIFADNFMLQGTFDAKDKKAVELHFLQHIKTLKGNYQEQKKFQATGN